MLGLYGDRTGAEMLMQHDRLRNLMALVVALFIPLSVGALGGAITAPAVRTWYSTLNKPGWTPPDAVFAPVWTILYATMGVVAWLVWRQRTHAAGATQTLSLLGVQLVLNFLWSVIFFGLHAPGLALLEIGLLWVVILFAIVRCWSITPLGAALLAPYLGWVTFAGALNGAVWFLNR